MFIIICAFFCNSAAALKGAVQQVDQSEQTTGTYLPASSPPLKGDGLIGLVGFNAF